MKPIIPRCPNENAPLLFADDREAKTRFIVKARCKLWSCEYCREVNAHQHYIRILNGSNKLIDQGQPLTFVTLTCHENAKTPEQSQRNWTNGWKKLQTRYRRANKDKGHTENQFVYVPECHRNGRIHIHGIFTGLLSTRWWKDNARQCGMGHQAKAVKIKSGIQATNYCTKYLTKQFLEQELPSKMRRVNYSRGFPAKPTFTGNLTFSVVSKGITIEALLESTWFIANYDAYLNGELVRELDDLL